MLRIIGGAILGAAVGLVIASLVFLAQAKTASSGGSPVHEYEWPIALSLLLIGAGAAIGALYVRRTRSRDIANPS